jgi:hypothetical protein
MSFPYLILCVISRSRLSVLNEKLTSLERKVDYLEARVAKAGESPN